MGYYTYYTLAVDHIEKSDVDKLVQELEGEGIVGYALSATYMFANNQLYFDGSDNVKWYDCSEDLTEISKHFPSALFSLHGEGEDREDIWDQYFKNGVSKIIVPEIVYPEFHESDLDACVDAGS